MTRSLSHLWGSHRQSRVTNILKNQYQVLDRPKAQTENMTSSPNRSSLVVTSVEPQYLQGRKGCLWQHQELLSSTAKIAKIQRVKQIHVHTIFGLNYCAAYVTFLSRRMTLTPQHSMLLFELCRAADSRQCPAPYFAEITKQCRWTTHWVCKHTDNRFWHTLSSPTEMVPESIASHLHRSSTFSATMLTEKNQIHKHASQQLRIPPPLSASLHFQSRTSVHHVFSLSCNLHQQQHRDLCISVVIFWLSTSVFVNVYDAHESVSMLLRSCSRMSSNTYVMVSSQISDIILKYAIWCCSQPGLVLTQAFWY